MIRQFHEFSKFIFGGFLTFGPTVRCLAAAAAAARRYVTEWEDWRTKARKEAVVEAETNERTKAASKLSEMCKALKVEEFLGRS